MAITRYTYRTPWPEFEQLTNRLSRILGEDYPTPSSVGDWMPAVNVEETTEELVLTAELPGMKQDEIGIELENNILTISGERRFEQEREDEDRRIHVHELRLGTFQRSFTLPRTVQGDAITAEYADGLLTVRMPKAAEAKGRRIQIGAGPKE